MRIFVTGATGFIGSAVVQDLLDAGHTVLGLARSDSSAAQLAAKGVDVQRGTLEDLDSLRHGAAEADAVIHTGFIHDFSNFKENCEIDRRAIDTMGSVLAGSTRPLVITSGVGMLSLGRPSTEADQPTVDSSVVPRIASEEAAAVLAARGVHTSVVRLPPSVHGAGDHGFVPRLIEIAREKGVSAYIGEGQNRWPAVHRLDAARLFRLAAERAAPKACYHGIGEEGVPTKEIAAVIAKHLGQKLVSLSPEEAGAHFGWLGYFFGLDCPSASTQTRQQLDWNPTQPLLLSDMAHAGYFTAKA